MSFLMQHLKYAEIFMKNLIYLLKNKDERTPTLNLRENKTCCPTLNESTMKLRKSAHRLIIQKITQNLNSKDDEDDEEEEKKTKQQYISYDIRQTV